MTINNFDWNHLFVNSMVNETTVSAKKINIAGLNADWSFFILIVKSLLITLLSTDFSVFPITSQCTRRVWPVIRDCALLYDTFFYLFFVEDRFCAASFLYFSFVHFWFWTLFGITKYSLDAFYDKRLFLRAIFKHMLIRFVNIVSCM